jgi:hypothetical protein
MSSQKKMKMQRSIIFCASLTSRPFVPRKRGVPSGFFFEKGQVEPLAEFPIFGIKRVFERAVAESLLLDETEQKTLAATRKQRFPMKHLSEKETIEPCFLGLGKQPRSLEKIARLDGKTQRLLMTAIIPVELEFVHVGDDPPCGEDRLGPDHAAPGKTQIVETLAYRGSGVSLPLLVSIEGTAYVFELAEHLRNLARCSLAEVADSKIDFANAAVCTCAGDSELRIKREPRLGTPLAGLDVAPCLAEEYVDERGFCRSLA